MTKTALHPRDELIEIITRIYQRGLTTTSGGNLSILDDDGSIWITPKGTDKGALTAKDIVHVMPDGTARGEHEPSSEYPFHAAVYKARPDMKAIVHAHPPSLVSFAITRKIPDTRILRETHEHCGMVGYAAYALPGSMMLGKVMAEKFAAGHTAVLMENHGIVTIGTSLRHAFQKLESLDLCATITLKAASIGNVHVLPDGVLGTTGCTDSAGVSAVDARCATEPDLGKKMAALVRRSYEQHLVTSTSGIFSARIDDDNFLITPRGVDRKNLKDDDLEVIESGMTSRAEESGGCAALHREIYLKHKGINAIVTAQPPNIMAFAVSDAVFDSRTIPESYIVLRDIRTVPSNRSLGQDRTNAQPLADLITEKMPVILRRNDCLVVTGDSLLQCFDRLEVAEFSARAIIASKALGPVIPIGGREIEDLEKAFNM
jgi:L-fuculose-phosphate aldolase